MDRFVAEIPGSERTVADSRVAQVLASRPPELLHLPLRKCILERVDVCRSWNRSASTPLSVAVLLRSRLLRRQLQLPAQLVVLHL